jgi:hyperosmotically inducible protein
MTDIRSSLVALLAIAVALGITACGKDEKPKPTAQPPASSQAPTAQPAPAPKTAAPAVAAKPAAPPPAAADPDKVLAAQVKVALERSKAVPGQQIDVTAKGGAVTLWGTVGDSTEQAKAVEAAKSVPGVKAVDNKLSIVKGS